MLGLIVTTIFFIGDVQINALSSYPDSIATLISNQIGSERIYDCGDLVEHGSMFEEGEYARYRELFPNAIPVPGNHDYYDGLNCWSWGSSVDTHDSGIHIVGFDTRGWNDPIALALLRNNLDDDGFTILYMHHQVYSDNLRNGEIAETIRPRLLPIIQDTEVDLVICSHGHAYERHFDGEITCLVIGGGGAPLDEVGTSSTQVMSSSEHHWLEIEILDNGADCTVHGLNGIIDEFFVAGSVSVPVKETSWGNLKALFR